MHLFPTTLPPGDLKNPYHNHSYRRNGRFRTTYHFDPSTSSLSGTLKCDVHYYEDGNVRLTTSKSLRPTTISASASSSSAIAIAVAKTIATAEDKYHEELNRGFLKLSEGEFKALRRQLPVTRQKVEWEKIGGYRVCLRFPDFLCVFFFEAQGLHANHTLLAVDLPREYDRFLAGQIPSHFTQHDVPYSKSTPFFIYTQTHHEAETKTLADRLRLPTNIAGPGHWWRTNKIRKPHHHFQPAETMCI